MDHANTHPELARCMPGPERMPLPPMAALDPAQRAAAQQLMDGPRGAVFGPFIPLLRSPELLNRLQQVGAYLRFDSALTPRISEFVMLVVSRQWTQQFEWCMHYPLALKAGVGQDTLDALAEGRRPPAMAEDEALAYMVCEEVARQRGLCDSSYAAALAAFGERGLIDLLGLIGYFSTVSIIMNVARTPPLAGSSTAPLQAFPL